MESTTTNTSSTNRAAGVLLALGVGAAAYLWRRKVGRKGLLPSLVSAVAVATGAGSTMQSLAKRFLLNSDAEPSRVDGRLAIAGDKTHTAPSGKVATPRSGEGAQA